MKDFKLKKRMKEMMDDSPDRKRRRFEFVEWQAVFNPERVGYTAVVNLGTKSKAAAKHIAQRKLRELLGKDKVRQV